MTNSNTTTLKKLMENIMPEEGILLSGHHTTREWLAVFARDGDVLGYSIIADAQDIEFLKGLGYHPTMNSGIRSHKEDDNGIVLFAKNEVSPEATNTLKAVVEMYFN
ncbi:MAG: hypothetical protein EOM35_03935 [Negativicutes bacterium]|nr:hypothetical protein [Negativicutes bacterium]